MAKKKNRKERDAFKGSVVEASAAEQRDRAPVRAVDKNTETAEASAASDRAVASSPHTEAESSQEKRQRMNDAVRAQREARRAHAHGGQVGDAPCAAGHVRRSTLYLSVALALVAGLFVGSLLPGLMGHSLSGAGVQPASQGTSAAQPSPQEDNATRLAGHILEMEEAVRKNPNDVSAWVQLGNLYFDSGKAPQSINAYERALLLKPDDANVLTDLGVMYRSAGKYELAVESFRKASGVDKKHQNALFNRGVVLFFDLQRKEEGRKVWQELLVLNPQAKAPDGKSLRDMLRDLK